MSNEITGALFKQMVLHGAAAITAQKQAINDLNVFPVPDGDTGTNMSMTIAPPPRRCGNPPLPLGGRRPPSLPPLCFRAPAATPA